MMTGIPFERADSSAERREGSSAPTNSQQLVMLGVVCTAHREARQLFMHLGLSHVGA
jgi:hypothetical protein